MKGDLSRFEFRPEDNFTGTVHQQGRGLLDQDGNAATSISRHLREQLGQDAIGPDVVAIPARDRDAFKILKASATDSEVTVSMKPGRGWIDGMHLYIPGPDDLELRAEYLGPPIDSPVKTPASIANGVRDAVILEAWEESFSAFQDPEQLLEPALGGPDTTGRVKLQYGLRLLRLGPDDECGNLADRLRDDFGSKGRLTVTPSSTTSVSGDCPVDLAGGYTGFEHYLYRIEIAEPHDGKARFKWSRFNGGLVGRGTYRDNAAPDPDTINIEANDQAIAQAVDTSGTNTFYLEVLKYVPAYGHWRTVLVASNATYTDGVLSLQGDVANPGGVGDGEEVFFRLWDGIAPIEEYQQDADAPHPLPEDNGIEIAFDPPTSDNGNYTPGDYWTFPVRAAGGEFEDEPWPDNEVPEGVCYHRAPLGILEWDDEPDVEIEGRDSIHDCRHVFQPLTRLDDCCTYRVGDGMVSHGDFDSIQDAINHLPPEGGRICVLPGDHYGPVRIDRPGVSLHGCGARSRILPATEADSGDPEPMIHVYATQNVALKHLWVKAGEGGVGVLASADEQGLGVAGLEIAGLELFAGADSAIKILDASDVAILDCQVRMENVSSPWPGVFVRADRVHVARNTVLVEAGLDGGVPEGRGGIQIAGTCEGVVIEDNHIERGLGNGITLGSLEEVDEQGDVVEGTVGWVAGGTDDCAPCGPGQVIVVPPGEDGSTRYQSAGAIYDLRIEGNRILDMGLNGIGVIGFFDLEEEDELITVDGLDILGNVIRGCLKRELAPPSERLANSMGYGGIALADVESLRVHDNVIEGNGPDHRYPVCGVFVLHAEGADISRNRIVNNGAKVFDEDLDPVRGMRGGVVVAFAMAEIVPLGFSGVFVPRQNGVPALRIHDNIVSQPLGHALFTMALGPVSVQGNALTSRGIVPGALTSLMASTVLIVNLGVSNEFYFQIGLFSGPTLDVVDPDKVPTKENGFVSSPKAGLDNANMGHYLSNGNILFSNNQVVTDLMEADTSFALSAVLLFSMDDVEFSDNQLDCAFLFDLLLTHTMVFGMSTRISDNRIKTSLAFAFFSIVSMGFFFNHTVDNQVTHCILTIDSPFGFLARKRERDNMVLMESILEGYCANLAESFGKGLGGLFGRGSSSAFVNTSMFG